jgi:benzodiazapine receptor
MHIRPVYKLIISLLIPLSVGAVAGYFTSKSINGWFETLNHPSFRPPNWLFGPVWTSLYILMGISLYLIWMQPTSDLKKYAINIFAIQMVLNFLWSFIFFYFHAIDIALVDISLLWLSLTLMLTRFYKVRPLAAYLNIPYICWVTFALVLNAAYYKLN